MGGQLVGNDCDDPDIIAEGEDPEGAHKLRVLLCSEGIEICEERYQGTFTRTHMTTSTSAYRNRRLLFA